MRISCAAAFLDGGKRPSHWENGIQPHFLRAYDGTDLASCAALQSLNKMQ